MTFDPLRGVLALDFESCSALDIDNGAWAYSQHPTTRLWCACFGYAETKDGPREFIDWLPGSPLPRAIVEFVRGGGTLVAHNAGFEQSMWANVCRPRCGWPEPDPLQWHDTMARGFAANLPQKLAGLARALGCPAQKDEVGAELMQRLAKAHVVAGEVIYPEPTPAELDRLVAYCRQDVAATLDCWFRLQPLSTAEERVYRADAKINARGVWLDQDFAAKCLRITDARAQRLGAEAFGASLGAIDDSTDTAALKRWLKELGVSLPKVRKKHTPKEWHWLDSRGSAAYGRAFQHPKLPADLRGLLVEKPKNVEQKARTRLRGWLKRAGIAPDLVIQKRDGEPVWRWVETADQAAVLSLLDYPDLPPQARALLEVRQEANKATSLAKLKRVPTMTGTDGRLRYALQFCGAHTGRWSSSGLQLHNLPKNKLRLPLGKLPKNVADPYPDFVLAALQEGSLEALEWLHPRPLEAVSQSLRSVVAAPPGFEIIGGDYAAIEARVVAWLAGQQDVLDLFASGADVYTHAAKNIGSDSRDLGKVCTLGLGFGMGPVKLITTAAKPPYFIRLEPKESARVVKLWRQANTAIASLWGDAQDAAFDALASPGREFSAGLLRFVYRNGCLFLVLPSGRSIRYWRPRVVTVEKTFKTIDEAGNIVESTRESEQLQFFTMGDDRETMVVEETYGGKLIENATQAVARDLMAAALVRFDSREDVLPYRVVMHVHDSIAAEVPRGAGHVPEFEAIMAECPPWARGCPVKAEGYRAQRFKG